MRTPSIIGLLIGAVLIFGLAGWFQHSVWVECREAGHSGMYCFRLISR